MGGKSWHPCVPMVVTAKAGEEWRQRFPSLALWDSYRRAVLSRTRGGVEATDPAAGVVFELRADGGGWAVTGVRKAG